MSPPATYPPHMSQDSHNSNTSPPSWHPERPHELPLLPPRVDLETKAVLRQCITARAALGELKHASELIPNQAMLINALPVLEAQASTEIENIVTTSDRLFRFLKSDAAADPSTKEALRYRLALMEGFQSLRHRPLGTRTAEQICSLIKGKEMQVRKLPGTALANAATGELIYTPPEGEQTLRALLANWERFLHESRELDPLIRLAAAHYQFEAIHPFTDGNGRCGRILNTLYLVQTEILTLPILYLSRYIIATKEQYYAKLLAVTRENAWEAWLLYLIAGIEETARWTLDRIAAIRQLVEETAQKIKTTLPKLYSRELIDLLFAQPYCRISDLVAAGLCQRQAASRHLKKLCEATILEERSFGREKLFVNRPLLDALTPKG